MAGLELVSDAGFRADGRRPDELRKVRARLGVLARADGSAYLEQGNTKVLAAVYGPHEVRGSRSKAPPDRALLCCRCSSAPFAGGGERRRRPPQGGGDRRSGERALLLRGVLEGAVLGQLYPRSQIDVHVQVLQADGGELGASVSAAGLALQDAGVALRGPVVAGSAGLAEPPAGPPVALSDLSAAEEAAGGPRLVVATVAGSGQLALCQLSARLHQERLRPVLDAAQAACRGLHAVLDGVVRARLRQDTAMEQ
ncbi:exosome complex component RRP41-like [Catharus ustulatus]|uniref:exosome complex component RRP41-like n=1 Tax=Catharus ustulatus TaxID=91951 RepID=UPI00140738DC|nr:exosome complex component RRP41-like isoform X1 [Catharus ustulatus]XP_032912671.1 exosome complex component RRP41-like isoform X1 [Catharus ustulatus]XP_032912688.1 exosome complex component RRP41-like isoform X2 [Catharus ustulatus]XP_032912699.1 exosome complex component RRP41-like isoform X1 [Catharus ustulatus]XP_032912700.1 exosome complex component RRP41-like [Catharus ustulatus]XP_032912701.1 exosome complex component RRP41-like [Catharus ustulatus]